jgi:AraC-like DNA-binding protein
MSYSFLMAIRYINFNFGEISGLTRVVPFPAACGTDKVSTASYRYQGKDRQKEAGVQVFQYSLSGCGAISIKGVPHAVPAGSGFLCNLYDPDVIYYYPPQSKVPWSFIYLTFRNADQWVQALQAAAGPVYAIPSEGPLLKQITHLIQHGQSTQSLTLSAGFELINLLFIEICRSIECHAPQSRGQRLVHRAIAAMQERVESSDGVAEIAAHLDVGAEHLCRIFRHELQTTPLAYFQRLKMNHAAALLRERKLPIKEIAQRMGHSNSNVANFTRLFQQHMGIPPGKFRDSVDPVFEPVKRRG